MLIRINEKLILKYFNKLLLLKNYYNIEKTSWKEVKIKDFMIKLRIKKDNSVSSTLRLNIKLMIVKARLDKATWRDYGLFKLMYMRSITS